MPKSSKRSSSKRDRNLAGQVRIIAGKWRGRKLPVLEAPGLRPTGDRVRETLFNWLQGSLAGRRCLDLFAGSGALGIEAASRGASDVVLVESNPSVATSLSEQLDVLQAGTAITLVQNAASDFLAANQQPFDIIFIDPPFAQQWHATILTTLANKHINPAGLIYVEAPTELVIAPLIPELLQIRKQRVFGEVTAYLLVTVS